jgi:hypothetical protein
MLYGAIIGLEWDEQLFWWLEALYENARPIFTHDLYYINVSKGFLVLLLRDYQHVENSAFNV